MTTQQMDKGIQSLQVKEGEATGLSVGEVLTWSDKHQKLTSEGARVVHVRQFLERVQSQTKKEILDQIEPRLYALHANIDFVHNSSARGQAKELLDIVDKLK